jgi:hypothetical protein
MGKWLSAIPTQCDICKRPLEKEFVDGRLLVGIWAILCPQCHETCGVGLGTGRGQKFDVETRECVAGGR